MRTHSGIVLGFLLVTVPGAAHADDGDAITGEVVSAQGRWTRDGLIVTDTVLRTDDGRLVPVLPEAKVTWEVAFVGGFFTAVLFNIGQFILGKVLIHARLASIFGATTSLALVLLFIFYCSFILYFGAAFTHEYASQTDQRILTNRHSRLYEEKLVEL